MLQMSWLGRRGCKVITIRFSDRRKTWLSNMVINTQPKINLEEDQDNRNPKVKVLLMLRKVVWADSWVVIVITQESAHATLRSIKRTLVQPARYPDIQVKILATYPTLHTKTHQRGLRWLRPDKQFGTNLIQEICQVTDLGKCCFAK